MMISLRNQPPEFFSELRGQMLVDEPMSKHTSWRTGGIADFFYTPADKTDLVQLLRQIPAGMPVHFIGLGSNLLVRDGGISGIVIRTSKGLGEIKTEGQGHFYAESGVSCAKVAKATSKSNLTGVEFLAGVPGSFGGALAMNAGAFGGETWDWVESIECVNRDGICKQFDASEIAFGYRTVALPSSWWILSGTLMLKYAKSDYNGKDKIRSLLDRRSQSQPIQTANAGSVFRNPKGNFAARLIESAGLKGQSVGEAEISDLHANFIVNRGRAKSSDIEALINIVKERVLADSGIDLELEVRIIGRDV